MESRTFRTDELVGLGVAVLLHIAIVAILLTQPEPEPVTVPERVTVSLATDVGLADTAPEPVPESRAPAAPVLADTPGALDTPPEVLPAPVPEIVPEAAPPPPRQRRTEAAPARRQPQARPNRPRQPQTRRAPPRQPARRAAPERTSPQPAARRGGGSRIGADFLPGAGESTTSQETRAPARTFGAREAAGLRSAITRQLRPHWRSPQGVDADKIVTILTWRMNADGSLAGTPTVVSQSGINDANRAQAEVHAERAIRAVQLAAPFNLPEDFYDNWKYIRDWRFDRRL